VLTGYGISATCSFHRQRSVSSSRRSTSTSSVPWRSRCNSARLSGVAKREEFDLALRDAWPCRRMPSDTQRRSPSSGTMPTSVGACRKKVGKLGLGSVAWPP
jgi:hypothetical protein